jgi:ceramide glucosyltransferase
MTLPILAATTFCIATAALQIASSAIAAVRLRRPAFRADAESCVPAERLAAETPQSTIPMSTIAMSTTDRLHPLVSLVRPVCGLDNYAADTLRSTFELDDPRCEILFCVASADDPVVPLVQSLIAAYPKADARLLIGDDRVTSNPKLNNVLKGWRAAGHDWIIIADSNVLMPPDYTTQLFASWREDTGLVASPPIGCRPRGFWAEVECAFLNTYEARWQYVADALGFGFAQGKTMLWRRADLERAGGIEMLANEVAEDAASTKVVRGAGLRVRLIDRPLAQPLGHRTAAEVWNRQVRWARLRRSSFFFFFLPESISGGALPMLVFALIAPALGLPVALSVASFGAVWYSSEMLLAAAAGWHLSPLSPLYAMARDLILPVLFVAAMRSDDFTWRGNEMAVERMQPRRMMARVRPRLGKFAPRARARLRELRERMS